MLSGRRLDLLDPSPLDVEVEDIAHGLSRVARWNGQTSGSQSYSVAEHSLLVERLIVELKENIPSRSAKLRYVIKKADFYDFETDILKKFGHLIEIENFGNKL